jgi:uncharacterized membrane protein YdbT with pleckstrin-like domain
LILYIAELLGVPLPVVELYEESVVEMLSEYIPEQNDEEIKMKKKRERNKKIKRYVMIGLASVGGGAIIGINIDFSYFTLILEILNLMKVYFFSIKQE